MGEIRNKEGINNMINYNYKKDYKSERVKY